jgi:phosphoglycerate dehydrogenase-like enzyme
MVRILVEDDPYLRLVPVILDPDVGADRVRAIADFMAHDIPDFAAWCRSMREEVPELHPAKVVMVSDREQLRAALPDADAAIIEALPFGEAEAKAAPNLAIVQKFGTILADIDAAACARHGIPVAVQRRRVNIAVAEHAFALMIALAKRLVETAGLVEERALREAGFDPTPYDRRFTTNSNFARIPKLKTLNGSVFGALGAGEIGRELARRASAFGMKVIYHQRTRMRAEEETEIGARYGSFDELLGSSDFIAVNLPLNAATRHILDRAALGRTKPDVVIVNTARAALIAREALMESLESGHLGGYGLDVGYSEPAEEGEPLLKFANVILTPHTAVAGRENGLEDLADMFRNLARAVAARRSPQ